MNFSLTFEYPQEETQTLKVVQRMVGSGETVDSSGSTAATKEAQKRRGEIALANRRICSTNWKTPLSLKLRAFS